MWIKGTRGGWQTSYGEKEVGSLRRTQEKKATESCLMRLPANLTMAHRISVRQIRHPPPYQVLNTFLLSSYRAEDTQPAAYAQHLMSRKLPQNNCECQVAVKKRLCYRSKMHQIKSCVFIMTHFLFKKENKEIVTLIINYNRTRILLGSAN